jgi:hypothetical protein
VATARAVSRSTVASSRTRRTASSSSTRPSALSPWPTQVPPLHASHRVLW